jgi:fumarate reductase subunit D
VATLDKLTFRAPPLFSYSLVYTAKEMWRAKIYPLFVLVMVLTPFHEAGLFDHKDAVVVVLVVAAAALLGKVVSR